MSPFSSPLAPHAPLGPFQTSLFILQTSRHCATLGPFKALVTNTLTNVVRTIFDHLRNGKKIVCTAFARVFCDHGLRHLFYSPNVQALSHHESYTRVLAAAAKGTFSSPLAPHATLGPCQTSLFILQTSRHCRANRDQEKCSKIEREDRTMHIPLMQFLDKIVKC